MNYTPAKLAAISRYQNYFPTLTLFGLKLSAGAESAAISALSGMKQMPGTDGSAARVFKEDLQWDLLKTFSVKHGSLKAF